MKTARLLKVMSEEEKIENHKIIKNMNKRINYKRNPRYTIDKMPVTYNQILENGDELREKGVL